MEFEQLLNEMYETFPRQLTNDDVHYVCIGTDRSTGDSLAPMVGSILKDLGYENVVGTLDEPVHAMNLAKTIEALPTDKVIIALDASLGQLHRVGDIQIYKGATRAGSGVNKELPPVGGYSIQGIVNVGGFMEYFVLQNTRLSLVKNLANQIVDLILHRFPLDSEEDKNFMIA